MSFEISRSDNLYEQVPRDVRVISFLSFYALEARRWILVKMSMLLNCKKTSFIEVFVRVLYEDRGFWGLQGLFGEIRWGDCNCTTKTRKFARTSRVSFRKLARLLFLVKVTRESAIEWCMTEALVYKIRRVTSLRKHVRMHFAQNVKIANFVEIPLWVLVWRSHCGYYVRFAQWFLLYWIWCLRVLPLLN